MQDSGNLYYSRHTFNNEYNANGSIFTIDEDAFKRKETIIYGHNMQNKLMFSELVNFYNEKFLNSNKFFKVYTKIANFNAEIINVYTENNKILDSLNFNEENKYYKDLNPKSNKIVKLVTCDYGKFSIHKTNRRCNIIASLKEIK